MRDVGLVRKKRICEILGVCSRTVDNYATLHEQRRTETGDAALASSPNNGLYSLRMGASKKPLHLDPTIKWVDTRQRRFYEGDAWEYIENITLEALQQPLKNRRRDTRRARR